MEIELGQLIRSVGRWWWVPVVLGLVLGGLGYGSAILRNAPQYTATTQMLVTSQISGDPVLSADARTETYIALVTSGPVLDRVIAELELEYTRQDLTDGIVQAQRISGTQIIEVSVTTDDPELSADIANSLARNFVTTATDLSIGELQRNLDDLRFQSNTIRDQITVFDARIDELDTDANEDDAAVQAELAQLRRDRLQSSQILADLDSSIREITTNLSTTSIPVVVTDFARAPEDGTGATRPLLVALLGLFLGALIGAAWITWSAFTDSVLRSTEQLVSLPVIATIDTRATQTDDRPTYPVLEARLAGILRAHGHRAVVITAPREDPTLGELRKQFVDSSVTEVRDIGGANGVLDNADAMDIANRADAAIILATIDLTDLNDLKDLSAMLEMVGTRVLGTVVVID